LFKFAFSEGEMMFKSLVAAIILLASTAALDARELKVATWNMGWHLSRSEAATWIGKCGAPFKLNRQTGLWEPAQSGTQGWELTWGRDAPIDWDISTWPPCDVYKNPAFKIVPVTETAYGKRLDQLAAFVASKVQADIIAFQEVSGEQAVRDLLPSGGADYYVCSFSSHKVQRLAFAWKKELGSASECSVEPALGLPSLDPKDQVRPGLSLALNIDGATFRLLSVHLKSSCVSPLEPRGDLAGNEPACATLQQQVVPLERWIEQKSADTGRFIILGDFNRSLWHEKNASGAVRTDSSDPSEPLPSTAKVRNLFKEINDGKPITSTVTLLTETCPLNAASQAACAKAENPASVDEWKSVTKTLTLVDNLGCRNPVGLDHILIGQGLSSTDQAQKVALGKQGRALSANATHPDPLLALSDHCPLTATVKY
jgi:endonuclease/exonuclease/phosphatase family metal-dependent hydrolase